MKKMVCFVLSLVLCLMMASAAMAVTVDAVAGDKTVKVELTEVTNPPISATAPYDKDYEYGTTRIGQYILNNNPKTSFIQKRYVAKIVTEGAAAGYYVLQIPYDVFGGSFDAKLYYAEYDKNYTVNESVYKNWKTTGTETGSFGGGKGLAASVPFKADGSTPIVIAWKKAGANAGGVGPSTPAGGSVDMSNVDMPQTGDESSMMLWAALAMMSVAGLGLMLRKREAA